MLIPSLELSQPTAFMDIVKFGRVKYFDLLLKKEDFINFLTYNNIYIKNV